MKPADSWTHAAARLPLAFAQVREDPQVDAALLEGFNSKARVVMIASGGDTAALLVARGLVADLRLVDANPAQLALTRLKLHLLRQAQPDTRSALLGHHFLPTAKRAEGLAALREELSLPETMFGPADFVAEAGPDYAGRYEVLFHHLREHLATHRTEIAALMSMDDPAIQAQLVAPGGALRKALDQAFDEVMCLENLVALFGAEATRNPLQDFPRHFAERTFQALTTFPARKNPFLAQLLLDPPNDAGFPDWLLASAPKRWPEIIYTHSTMVDALRELPEAEADFVHLSNILDWLSPEAATETFALAWRALRPGGMVVVRQLNSSLDIPPLGPRFGWLRGLAAAWHQRDRTSTVSRKHLPAVSRWRWNSLSDSSRIRLAPAEVFTSRTARITRVSSVPLEAMRQGRASWRKAVTGKSSARSAWRCGPCNCLMAE